MWAGYGRLLPILPYIVLVISTYYTVYLQSLTYKRR